MARLYVDEDVPIILAFHLRSLGHDVETTDEAGRKSESDSSQLAYAVSHGRAIIVHNKRHYRRLHRASATHAGIIECTRDDGNEPALAARIHQTIAAAGPLAGGYLRVYR